MPTKTCSRCRSDLPTSDFNLSRRAPGGFQARCKSCQATAYREKKATQPDLFSQYARRSRLKTYGMTEKCFEGMVEAQGGNCAICSAPFASNPCIDHNHETGAVRGILCSKCNCAIGLLGDSPDRLLAAASYLNDRGSYARNDRAAA